MEPSLSFRIIFTFLPLLIAVVLHEMAHGWTALKLGDDTAKRLGRISLNPIRHIDPFLTIILPALLIMSGSPIIFGGAKPVPVNVFNLKNPKRDMAIVAAAGPASNIILAAIGLAALYFFRVILGMTSDLLLVFGIQWILMNVALALFNLFPVPPLDGGRIAVGILPRPAAAALARTERFGFIIIIILLYAGAVESLLMPAIRGVAELIQAVLG